MIKKSNYNIMNSDDYEIINGGFPRIKIKINKLEQKQEQGFSKILSINDILNNKNNNNKKLSIINTVPEINIINNRVINGIDIDLFAKP